MFIKEGIQYVGVNDQKLDLFEGQYVVPDGMAYNSYVILDEKIAVFDTVDGAFKDEWLQNLERTLDGKSPDYLIVQHMEPDHSANVLAFIEKYPSAKIAASSKAFVMMKNYFGKDFADKQIVLGDGDSLCLGVHELVFYAAPMVHWPEVLVTYDKTAKVLFSADAFGKFGAIKGNITDVDEDWACEARRYYFGIVGKYGVQVQNLLKKLSVCDIQTICPLHGPVLVENLPYYLDLYNTWSNYGVESEGVLIAYTSVYGNTKKAVELLAERLLEKGCEKVVVQDLARCDMSEAVEDAFRYGKIVLATTTYNGEIFPFMRDFISHLTEHNFQNRTVGFIENGSWAPMATRVMRGMLEKCKNMQYTESTVKILSSLSEENLAEVDALAAELCQSF
ncbi:MAG: FprA family A-type flavoprotein [Clostridiales bacterium]|nr:FprA family A-type flavoprotein [Clostridiales bacterium]